MNTLIIGIGNPLRCDDGAGLAVLEKLQGVAVAPLLDVKLVHHDGDGLSLINLWQAYGHVILIDAACGGGKPGMIHRFDASAVELPRDLLSCSSHLFGPAEAIELARSLNRLPADLRVYGIEGMNFSYGEGLSPQVVQAVAGLAGEIALMLGEASGPVRQ